VYAVVGKESSLWHTQHDPRYDDYEAVAQRARFSFSATELFEYNSKKAY